MGNAPSRHPSASSAPQHSRAPSASSSHANPNSGHGSQPSQHGNPQRGPRRRESIQTLTSTARPTAAPPSANLEAASGRIVRPPSRSRSQTIATPQLKSLEPIATEKMGGEQSTLKNAPQQRHASPRGPSPSLPGRNTETTENEKLELDPSPSDVASPVLDQLYLPTSHFARPPRLPLPIEEERHTPGSPIISPADLGPEVDPIEVEAEALPRRANSVLSSTTADDDDELSSELQPIDGASRPAVPTVIEWRGGGDKVYVTGTFAGWDRKYRLFKDGPSRHKDAVSATINLAPGTHHIKFIIDGDMRVSDQLPTAVDFTNILVNYIEVSPDDLPQVSSTEATKTPGPPPKPEYRVPPGVFPPQVLPPTPELQAVIPASSPAQQPQSGGTKPTQVAPAPPKRYHSEVPRFLIDLDAPEDSPCFARSSAVVNSAPAPPSLPMFLGKSILNGSTPMKDDASVLIMPNHTVLNHLATSSIRNHVLATSATTRYKRKFLTTVMYKPTSDIGD